RVGGVTKIYLGFARSSVDLGLETPSALCLGQVPSVLPLLGMSGDQPAQEFVCVSKGLVRFRGAACRLEGEPPVGVGCGEVAAKLGPAGALLGQLAQDRHCFVVRFLGLLRLAELLLNIRDADEGLARFPAHLDIFALGLQESLVESQRLLEEVATNDLQS